MADSQFHSLTVANVEPETDSAIKVSFAVPEALRDTFKYQQGQYLTLESNVDGETVRRSYSICSGINDAAMQVAIKRVEGGVFSNFANDSLKRGATVQVMPARQYLLPSGWLPPGIITEVTHMSLQSLAMLLLQMGLPLKLSIILLSQQNV